jgi:ZIP family zinc transporter
MRAQGRSQAFILGTWTVCAVLLTAAVVIGAGPLSSTSNETLSLPLAFAAGAVLASLADTLMPEAYEQGGPTVALSTTAGFVLSYVLSTL